MYLFRPIRVRFDSARHLSTVNICLNQSAVFARVFANRMDFLRWYISKRRIIYVYVWLKVKEYQTSYNRGGIISSILFIQNFNCYDIQIGATDILLRPSFDCKCWLYKLGHTKWQPATLSWRYNWKIYFLNQLQKHFFSVVGLRLTCPDESCGADSLRRFLLWLAHTVFHKTNIPLPIHCVPNGWVMSSCRNIGEAVMRYSCRRVR